MLKLGFDDYINLMPNVLNHIELSLNQANREGRLLKYLDAIGYPTSELQDLTIKKEEKKILVIGYSEAAKRDLLNIASNNGYLDEEFDFELSEPDKFDYAKLKLSGKYRCILVGPIAHSQKGKSNSSSMIREMETNDDYPPVIRLLDKKNRLKISISSFESALYELQDLLVKDV